MLIKKSVGFFRVVSFVSALVRQSELFSLTHYTPKLASYRNQSVDLLLKPIGCFLYGSSFGV